MKKTILAAILLTIPSALFATALSDLELASGADLSTFARVQQNLQTGRKPNFLPRAQQDLLAGCSYIDAVFIRKPSLEDVARNVNRCFQDRFSGYNKRRFAITAETCSQPGCDTLEIVIRGEYGAENPFLLDDLRYSLSKAPRNGKIHDWTAKIVEFPRLADSERHF